VKKVRHFAIFIWNKFIFQWFPSRYRPKIFVPSQFGKASYIIWCKYIIVFCSSEKCGQPNISLSDYIVSTKDFDVINVTEWSNETFYNDGTTFVVQHKNISCGLETSNLSCTEGQWMGEFPPCEKGSLLDKYCIFILNIAQKSACTLFPLPNISRDSTMFQSGQNNSAL
jgi:hypothetical protein